MSGAFRFTDLEFKPHPIVKGGKQALYRGWSVIQCLGSKGFHFDQYEVQDPKGGIHGYLTQDAVELLIRLNEGDFFADDSDEIPF